MKIIKEILNRMKIRTKLIISYLSIVIITVLIVGIFLTTKMNSIVIDNAIKEGHYNSETIKTRLQEVLKMAINTSDMIYQDDRLHSLVKHHYESDGEVVTAYQNYSLLNEYLKYYSEFISIDLYVDNETILDGNNIMKVTDKIRQSEWYTKAIEDKGVITWSYKRDETTGKPRLSLVRAINSATRCQIGVLEIGINPWSLEKIIRNERYSSSILLDQRVIASNDLQAGEVADLGASQATANYYYDINEEFNEAGDYIILNTFKIDKSFNNTFQVLVHVPVELITVQSRQVIYKSILTIGLAILFSLVVILFFSKNFSDRIKILRNEMHKVAAGSFNIEKSIDGKDEIADIYDDLYIMVESINTLIDEVYVRKIKEESLMVKQKEAEFKMLASQINPHFLYNTLETIRMRAFCNGDRELAAIVKKLGRLMRRNLEVSNETVSLLTELELVEDYLQIQALRFEGKVEHEFKIEVNPKVYKILPLLLQPIVENAFVHGLEGRKEKGKIIVRVYENVGYLIVEISDNGCGMSREQLALINEKLGKGKAKENGHQSIGMSNINKRIKIFYGDKYGLHVLSELTIGTKVVLVLPTIKGEENSC